MRIALGQISTGKDKLANLALVREAVADASRQGAELIVFPEATMQGFGTGRLDNQAEPPTGEFVAALSTLADEHSLAIVAGIFCPADTIDRDGKTINRVSNTAVACLPGGMIHTYDKIHTYDAFGYAESDTVAAGKDLVTFDYLGITFGLAICYDIRFPQLFRAQARRGAQVILVPTSWADGPGKLEQWQLLTRARALDSTSIIVACDQAQPAEERSGSAPCGIGHSAVIAPDGTVIAEADRQAQVLCVDVEIEEQVRSVRRGLPVLDYPENYF